MYLCSSTYGMTKTFPCITSFTIKALLPLFDIHGTEGAVKNLLNQNQLKHHRVITK